MKRKLNLALALLLVFALLLPMAACGEKGGGETTTLAGFTDESEAPANANPVDPTEPPADGLTDPADVSSEDPTDVTGESETAGESGAGSTEGSGAATGPSGATDASGNPAAPTTAKAPSPISLVPGTPAEVLAAYTEVMNKAKKDAKSMRKLEYQQLGADSKFEANYTENPTVVNFLNDNIMTSRDKSMKEDRYTQGTGDMVGELPISKNPLGCLAKDPGGLSKATARQLSNGNIELTLVMKPEDNPEPANQGAPASPSRTGEVFNPMSKAGVDDIISKFSWLFTTKPTVTTRYFDCKSTLVYNPNTKQIVSLRQDYNVKIDILTGVVLWAFNAVGYAILENVMVCDNFSY